MSTKTYFTLGALVTIVATAVGCSAPTEDASAAPDGLQDEPAVGQAIVYSYDTSGNLWSANATGTAQDPNSNQAYASFTGPAGLTRKMGLCLLKKGKNSSGAFVACSSASGCTSAPSVLPTGGVRYCTAPNGGTTKYCYYRPGGQTSYCAGSPALGGTAVAAGSYATPAQSTGNGVYISYACFEGCAATDPSSSSDEHTIVERVMCGSVYC